MLVGKELLDKARSLSDRPEDEIAKGYKLRSNGPGRAGNRSSRGRQAEFRTKVHGNGNLLIGHAYTKKLGLEPGQEFRIDVRKESGAISLLPLKK